MRDNPVPSHPSLVWHPCTRHRSWALLSAVHQNKQRAGIGVKRARVDFKRRDRTNKPPASMEFHSHAERIGSPFRSNFWPQFLRLTLSVFLQVMGLVSSRKQLDREVVSAGDRLRLMGWRLLFFPGFVGQCSYVHGVWELSTVPLCLPIAWKRLYSYRCGFKVPPR